MRPVRLLLGLLTLLLVGSATVAAVAWDGQRALTAPLPIADEHVVVFERGWSLARLVTALQQAGHFPDDRTAVYLRGWVRLQDAGARLKAGEYVLRPGTTPLGLVEQLVAGRVREYAFTIVEGWNLRELLAAIHDESSLRKTLDTSDGALAAGRQVMAALGAADVHPEGQFLPETYRYTRGATDLDLLRRAHAAMQQAMDAIWAQRVDDLPIETPYEMLTLASIIEKETGKASERRQIAGVFARRLQRGMRLQTDPTVIYGLGEDFDGDIRYRDLRTDTPYNSYTRGGLPPSPICMPGEAALAAAVDPAAGDALYFVSRGDGSHVFSATLAEHNKAVRRYQLGQ